MLGLELLAGDNRNVITGLKCVKYEKVYHWNCSKLVNNVKQASDSDIVSCGLQNENAKLRYNRRSCRWRKADGLPKYTNISLNRRKLSWWMSSMNSTKKIKQVKVVDCTSQAPAEDATTKNVSTKKVRKRSYQINIPLGQSQVRINVNNLTNKKRVRIFASARRRKFINDYSNYSLKTAGACK